MEKRTNMKEMYYSNFSKPMYENIDKLIALGKIHGKKIILFGLNSSSYVIRDYLAEQGFNITAYIDNNEKKRAAFKEKIPAYSPEEMKQVYGLNKIVILIISKYYQAMKAQLESMGYKENRDIFQVIDMNDLEKYVDYSDILNMREIGAAELKEIQMALLRYMKNICEDKGLRYYLCGGTLLGAIRHKGYIPWDDDIDVVMPMADYKKFIKTINEMDDDYQVLSLYGHQKIFHGFYARLLCPDTLMKTWVYPCWETIGINIDIFPLFGLPEGEEEADRFATEMEELHVRCSEEFIKYLKPSKNFYKLQKDILERMEWFEFDKSRDIAYLFSRHKKKEIMPRDIYENSIMTEFEGELYPIPVGYDEYLFGDHYMELPPEKERMSVHNYRAFVDKNWKFNC